MYLTEIMYSVCATFSSPQSLEQKFRKTGFNRGKIEDRHLIFLDTFEIIIKDMVKFKIQN